MDGLVALHLLYLPVEIRCEIFRHLVRENSGSRAISRLAYSNGDDIDASLATSYGTTEQSGCSIVRVNRQLRAEVYDWLLGKPIRINVGAMDPLPGGRLLEKSCIGAILRSARHIVLELDHLPETNPHPVVGHLCQVWERQSSLKTVTFTPIHDGDFKQAQFRYPDHLPLECKRIFCETMFRPLQSVWQKRGVRVLHRIADSPTGSKPLSRRELEIAMLIAVQEGHCEVLKQLCRLHPGESTTLMSASDERGWTPLVHAIRAGHGEMVDLLVESGIVDLRIEDHDGRTFLSHAAQTGSIEILDKILDSTSPETINTVNIPNCDGYTPLMFAAGNGRLAAVKRLLRQDVDVNGRAIDGSTAFSLAAENGHEDTIRLLLDDGRTLLNIADVEHRSPLIAAVTAGHQSVAALLLLKSEVDPNVTSASGWSALSTAASLGDTGLVELLLKHRCVRLNVRDANGMTPLALAACHGHTRTVSTLTRDSRVDLNAKDTLGNSPLMFAVKNGHNGVVSRLLRHHSVRPNARDPDGRTPLHHAVTLGNTGAVELLLQHWRIRPALRDTSGYTALALAAKHGHHAITKHLLEKSTRSALLKDRWGRTPLLLAIQHGQLEIVNTLLLACAKSTNLRDKRGRHSLIYAAQRGDVPTTRRLLRGRCTNLNLSDSSGRTALSYAVQRNAQLVAEMLRNR